MRADQSGRYRGRDLAIRRTYKRRPRLFLALFESVCGMCRECGPMPICWAVRRRGSVREAA